MLCQFPAYIFIFTIVFCSAVALLSHPPVSKSFALLSYCFRSHALITGFRQNSAQRVVRHAVLPVSSNCCPHCYRALIIAVVAVASLYSLVLSTLMIQVSYALKRLKNSLIWIAIFHSNRCFTLHGVNGDFQKEQSGKW